MSNMPILKFEKSTNYLNKQLDIQSNNKQLVTNIISNIGLFLEQNPESTYYDNYLNIKESANIFLQIFSKNITTIESLSREIKHITYDLTEVLAEASRKEKSKEYYIAAISTIKNNIETYTAKFQSFEQKIEKDNIDFNEFININNIKYNFTSNRLSNTYEFSGFSIDNVLLETNKENQKKEAKIDELTNEFKNMLSNLSEDAVLSLNLVSSLENKFNLEQNKENLVPTENETLDQINLETLSSDEEVNNENNDSIEISESTEFKSQTPQANDSLEELEQSSIEAESEVAQEENLEDDSPDIIIDYASIYGNYFKNAKTIEENISSEYSTFDLQPSNFSKQEKIESSSTLENDSKIEEISEDIDVDIENDILDSLSDDDILAELLMLEDNSAKPDSTEIDYDNLDDNILDNTDSIFNILESSNPESQDIAKEESLLVDNSSESSEITTSETEENTVYEVNDEKIGNLENETNKNDDKNNFSALETKITTSKIFHNNISNMELDERIKIIKEGTSNNDSLIISEKQDKIFLPYTIDELEKYLKSYPDVYNSAKDVVEQEFTLSFKSFFKYPTRTRFVETYNLIRNRSRKSVLKALIYAFKLARKYNLSPAVIAACKNEQQLETYLYCLNSNSLNKFKIFRIIYEINPLEV